MLVDEGSFREIDGFVQHQCTNFGMTGNVVRDGVRGSDSYCILFSLLFTLYSFLFTLYFSILSLDRLLVMEWLLEVV